MRKESGVRRTSELRTDMKSTEKIIQLFTFHNLKRKVRNGVLILFVPKFWNPFLPCRLFVLLVHWLRVKNLNGYIFIGPRYLGSDLWVRVSVRLLSDVTLADEDTNRYPTVEKVN